MSALTLLFLVICPVSALRSLAYAPSWNQLNAPFQLSIMRPTTSVATRRRSRADVLVFAERLTDAELAGVQLDPSTLDASERERLEAVREIQKRMAEVESTKHSLSTLGREQEYGGAASSGSAEYAPSGEGAKTAEAKRAESFRNIERNLAEVSAIQRQLGIEVDDIDEEKDIEVSDTRWRGQAGLDVTVSEGNRNWSDLGLRRILAVGDVVALVFFAYIGRASHGMPSLDLGVLSTALPFLTGWLAMSPLIGAYTNSATATQGDMAKTLIPAWAVSIPVGIGIRALSKGGEIPPIPFVVTTMIFTLLVLLTWRGAYTAINPTSTSEFKKGGIVDGFRMITTLLQRW